MTIKELSVEQKEILKCYLFCDLVDKSDTDTKARETLLKINDPLDITDEILSEYYEGINFVDEDFV